MNTAAVIGIPPETASWAFVLACRDLASDLAGLRADLHGAVNAPLHCWQKQMLIDLLTREANRIEDLKTDLFLEQLS